MNNSKKRTIRYHECKILSKLLLSYIMLTTLFLLNSAQAAEPSAAVILKFPGKNIHFKLPDGFCLPSGNYLKLAESANSLDKGETVHFIAFRCETMRTGASPLEYLLIKSPTISIEMDSGDRAAMLNNLRKNTTIGDVQKKSGDGLENATKHANAKFRMDIKTNIHVTQKADDSFGFYSSSYSDVVAATGVLHSIGAGSVTVVDHRLIELQYMRMSFNSPGSPTEALEFVQLQTRRLVEENEH